MLHSGGPRGAPHGPQLPWGSLRRSPQSVMSCRPWICPFRSPRSPGGPGILVCLFPVGSQASSSPRTPPPAGEERCRAGLANSGADVGPGGFQYGCCCSHGGSPRRHAFDSHIGTFPHSTHVLATPPPPAPPPRIFVRRRIPLMSALSSPTQF